MSDNDHLKRGDEVYWVEMPRNVVQAVDKIVEKSKHRPRYVEDEKDWEIVEDIWHLWKRFYPKEYHDFMRDMKETTKTQLNPKYAVAPMDDGSQIRHIAEMPGRFHRMLNDFYPEQEFHKRFMRELIRRIPDMKVPDKI